MWKFECKKCGSNQSVVDQNSLFKHTSFSVMCKECRATYYVSIDIVVLSGTLIIAVEMREL